MTGYELFMKAFYYILFEKVLELPLSWLFVGHTISVSPYHIILSALFLGTAILVTTFPRTRLTLKRKVS
jgi:hypothetical protein